jgi:hypothetical protein
MKRYTSYADRQEIVTLRKGGCSYQEIVGKTGWSAELVGKVWRGYQKHGEAWLHPKGIGRPARGALSSFDPKVKFASLRIKRKHRRWGPDVVRAELAKQPWAQQVKLPSASQIGVYFSQFRDRLIKVRPHKQLPQKEPLEPALRVPHGCWQLDMDERIRLPGCGLVNVLNLVDYATGIKIGSFVFSARRENGRRCRVSWEQMQSTLRQAFTKWGLPNRIRTDRDRVIVANGDYPFPKLFTLWLVGLGIEHELIRRVIENGCVERAHQTWEARLDGYGPFDTLPEWQVIVNYELWRMNAVLPSRGRNCRRYPPLMVYPQARSPLRWYRPQDEFAIFDLARVHIYLSLGEWFRKTSVQGTFSFNRQQFYLGRNYCNRFIRITFDPQFGFRVTCPPDKTVIKFLEVQGLTVSDITGFSHDDMLLVRSHQVVQLFHDPSVVRINND